MKKNLTKMINKKTHELYNKKCNKEEFKEKRKEFIKFLHEVYSQEHNIKSLHKRLHYINNVENQFTGILNSILTGLISTLMVYIFIDDKLELFDIVTEILNSFSQVINSNENLLLTIVFLLILILFFIALLIITCLPIISILFVMIINMSNEKNDVFLTYDIERKLIIKSMGINRISINRKPNKVKVKRRKV